MNEHQIIDRNGKNVMRANGIIQDGDRLVVKMNMMDAADPRLIAAASLADAVRRNETFDSRGHQPGSLARDAATTATIHQALDERDARLTNAWRNPAAVVAADTATKPADKGRTIDPSAGTEALFAARDQAIADRDRRIEDAWKKSS